jgi:hypothetical protein
MNDDQPQDKHPSEPPKAVQASTSHSSDSPISGTDSSVTQGRGAAEDGEGARADAMQDADRELEQTGRETPSHENASQEPAATSTAKESVQSIPSALPEGGKSAEHLTPEQLLEVDNSQQLAREVAIQSSGTVPVQEPVRYDTVLFAPKAPPMSPGVSAPGENAKPVRQSPFQRSGPESSYAGSGSNLEMPEPSSSETDSSAESEIIPEGEDPALPSSEAGEQRVPNAKPQFQGIVQLSGPNPAPSAAPAAGGNSGGTAPPRTPDSASTQPLPAAEKISPLPRVIVMVGLDDAERIVHEEMRVFSRELAIVCRQIAQEETENLMFDFRAQMNALFG